MVLGQLSQRLRHQPGIEYGVRVVGARVVREVVAGDLSADPRTAPVVDDEVARHREQSGPGPRLVLGQDGRSAPRPQQRLLDDVLGQAVVTGQPDDEAPERGSVYVVQLTQQRRPVIGHWRSALGVGHRVGYRSLLAPFCTANQAPAAYTVECAD